jgi:hypothetical protein
VQKTISIPKGYWGDPSGNVHRMSGEQEIIATVTPECSGAEFKALARIAPPNPKERTTRKSKRRKR